VTSELLTDEAQSESEIASPEPWPATTDAAARNHFYLALAFLALSVVLLSAAAVQLVLPDFFVGSEFLTYGRVLPVATNLFMFGWLTLGLLGAIYWILPRVSGVPLQFAPLANLSGLVLAVGTLAGSGAVALGANEGRQYLEMPLWADALVVLALLGAVRAVTATITDRTNEALSPVEWYFGAAPIWLVLTVVVGNIPGVIGVNAVLQTAFFRGALFGLWFAAAGVGIVYYLVPKLTGGSPHRLTQLSAIGFWSLGFVWALSGASALTYSAAPDWYETLGIVFAISLFLPVLVVFVDILRSLRGRWGEIEDTTPIRFVVAGAVLFALFPVVNVIAALRASNAIVGFTDWVAGVDTLALLGAFSFWLIALLYHAVPALREGEYAYRAGPWHLRLSLLGLLLAVGAMLVGGLQAGLTWVGAANSGAVAAGDGFRDTVVGLEGVTWVRTIGVALFALAQLWFVAVLGWHALSTDPEPTAARMPDASADDESEPGAVGVGFGQLRGGTIGMFAVAVVFGFVFPALEADHLTNTLTADETRYYEYDDQLATGRDLYMAEGCWYCHTQEVRQIVTDVGLGAVSVAGDYAWEVPPARGTQRIGPDLFHVGGREETATTEFLVDHLRDPRAARSWSTMPAYGHLTNAELDALAKYLANLE
jgi:cbb3-type cytochrome oxidase subunit 1